MELETWQALILSFGVACGVFGLILGNATALAFCCVPRAPVMRVQAIPAPIV